MDDDTTFAELMVTERQRITDERAALAAHADEVVAQMLALDREMAAITAYENAKAGKKAPAKTTRGTNGARRPRTSGRRESILAIVDANPMGVSRGELLEVLEIKGDKSAEMSVSNALSALLKTGKLARAGEGGKKYVLA